MRPGSPLRHPAPGGILAVWSYAENSPFVEALHAAFSVVETVPVSYVTDLVYEEFTHWLFVARHGPLGPFLHPHP